MAKKKKSKLPKIIIKEIVQPKVESIITHEMYKWEDMFLSRKGKKASLKGYV